MLALSLPLRTAQVQRPERCVDFECFAQLVSSFGTNPVVWSLFLHPVPCFLCALLLVLTRQIKLCQRCVELECVGQRTGSAAINAAVCVFVPSLLVLEPVAFSDVVLVAHSPSRALAVLCLS